MGAGEDAAAAVGEAVRADAVRRLLPSEVGAVAVADEEEDVGAVHLLVPAQ